MDDPELEHLAPDFDPRTLTVPRLRAILLAHDVDYPSSAKKPELIEIFNEHVVPQARKILKARAKTRPTTSGITDAPSTRASSIAGDDDNDGFVVATVEDTPRRTSRKSSTKQRASVAPSSRASTVERKRSSFSDTEGPGTVARRRTRVSVGVPAIKEESVTADDSPFSSDNPFQSGSSPLVDGAADDVANRRRSGLSAYKTPSKTPQLRQSSVASNGKRPSSSSALTRAQRESSFARMSSEEPSVVDEYEEDEEEYSSEAGEEFTPEELEELEAEEEQGLVRRDRRVARKTSGTLRSAPWAILVALLAGFATVWRQEKLNVGYCGVGRPSTSIGGVAIPEWAHFLRPECEPCPQHAYCYSQLETQCEPDFILQPHPLSGSGIIPIPPTCEPDGKKARNVKAVADRGVNVLRERNAQWECGELREADGSRAKDPRIAEADLKAVVSGKRRKGMSQDEFEDLWASALPEMQGREEVSADVDGSSGRRLLRSNSTAKLGLACAIRRSVRLAVARHLWKLIAVIAVLIAGTYARFSIASRRSIETQAKRLASIALDRLASQAAMHQRDAVQAPEAYMSMAQLRDDILRDEFSSRKRQQLWARVQAKVEGNSNVRPMVRSGRTGEVSRVWEWIGAIKAIEDRPSSFKRGSVSSDAVSVRSTAAADERTKRDSSRSRKWPDSRPIF